MITPADYYTLLGISRKASAPDIRAAYKRTVNVWRIRAASSEESVSGEAEKRLALLAEAYSVLSDAQRRAAYDRQAVPAVAPPPSNPTLAVEPSADWIERAERYLAEADYHAAAGAAHEATTYQGNSAESWSVLSRANAGLHKLDDAVYEARRAIELAPANPMYHGDLGAIYEELGRWDEALREYEQASRCDPTDLVYQLAIGGVWIQTNQPARALPIIERVYTKSFDDETACYYYAQALIAMAEAVPKDKSKDGYAVTSAGEIQQMREYLSRADGIKHLDQQTRQTIREAEVYLQRMEAHTFHVPLGAWSAFGAISSGYNGGCAESVILIGLMCALALAPLWLLLWGFGLLSSGEIGGGFLALLIGGGLGYVWYRAIWVPRWKVNARLRDHRIRNPI